MNAIVFLLRVAEVALISHNCRSPVNSILSPKMIFGPFVAVIWRPEIASADHVKFNWIYTKSLPIIRGKREIALSTERQFLGQVIDLGWWLSGRKRRFAKSVNRETGSAGSNPVRPAHSLTVSCEAGLIVFPKSDILTSWRYSVRISTVFHRGRV